MPEQEIPNPDDYFAAIDGIVNGTATYDKLLEHARAEKQREMLATMELLESKRKKFGDFCLTIGEKDSINRALFFMIPKETIMAESDSKFNTLYRHYLVITSDGFKLLIKNEGKERLNGSRTAITYSDNQEPAFKSSFRSQLDGYLDTLPEVPIETQGFFPSFESNVLRIGNFEVEEVIDPTKIPKQTFVLVPTDDPNEISQIMEENRFFAREYQNEERNRALSTAQTAQDIRMMVNRDWEDSTS